MNTPTLSQPLWSTASFGSEAGTSPMELSALGDHFARCQGARGRLFALRCAAEAMHGFASSRFVTTLVVTVALIVGVAFAVL
jgi:hypothetical protein